jgi:hypothetical protein
VGEGHVLISATDLNFRTWPRVAWTVVANTIYHRPSREVAAPASASVDTTVSGEVDGAPAKRAVACERRVSPPVVVELDACAPCPCGVVGGIG